MPIIIPTFKFGKCIEMKIFSHCMVVTIVYKVCTLSRKSIRFGGGLVYEFRYLHHCNCYHLKSRENDSYIMHASVLNNALTNIHKSCKYTNIMNIQKKENNLLQKKIDRLRYRYFKRFQVHFKRKTMFFFILENQTSSSLFF